MSGHTITRHATHPPVRPAPRQPTAAEAALLAPSRAARELGLKPGEFDLAVQLGRIRTVRTAARTSGPPGPARARWRVAREEIDRMRAAEGFPDALRERVRVVGTTEGAALMEITAARFTRLARLGLLAPVKFYLNRYRTVVWVYLAEELRAFAGDSTHRSLLTRRMPETLRGQLEAGVDLRARNWRGRYAGFLLREADDAWARAAVTASLLDGAVVSEVVKDPDERARLGRLRPDRPVHAAEGSPSADVVEALMTADDPDEIHWMMASLEFCVAEARGQSAVSGPAARPEPSAPAPVPASARRPDREQPDLVQAEPVSRRGRWRRLWRGHS